MANKQEDDFITTAKQMLPVNEWAGLMRFRRSEKAKGKNDVEVLARLRARNPEVKYHIDRRP